MSPAYTLPYHDVTTVNTNITASQLDEYLDAGCEFLPCAGIQGGTAFSDQGTYGYYWSSTSTPSGGNASSLFFRRGDLNPANTSFFFDGSWYSASSKTNFYSVRLVREP